MDGRISVKASHPAYVLSALAEQRAEMTYVNDLTSC